jgi:Flp pilus assembly pilin Flp
MRKDYSAAQSVLEYAVILALVAVALTIMQLYFKRGVQSAIKFAADQVGTQEDGESIDTSNGVEVVQNSFQ